MLASYAQILQECWINALAGNRVSLTDLVAEIVDELGDTLVAVGILATRIDDPELCTTHGSGDSSTFRVSRDELHILDTRTLYPWLDSIFNLDVVVNLHLG
jgi:hypothetical protein